MKLYTDSVDGETLNIGTYSGNGYVSIDDAGNVGIGTTPSDDLTLGDGNGDGGTEMQFVGSGSNLLSAPPTPTTAGSPPTATICLPMSAAPTSWTSKRTASTSTRATSRSRMAISTSTTAQFFRWQPI